MGGGKKTFFPPRNFTQPYFYFLCINGILILLLFSLHFTDLGRAYENTACRLLVVICQQSSSPFVEAETAVGVGGESGV